MNPLLSQPGKASGKLQLQTVQFTGVGSVIVKMKKKVCHCLHVPASAHSEMMASPSVGAYYARQIKGQFKLKTDAKTA
jgi:hypothetical protein